MKSEVESIETGMGVSIVLANTSSWIKASYYDKTS